MIEEKKNLIRYTNKMMKHIGPNRESQSFENVDTIIILFAFYNIIY